MFMVTPESQDTGSGRHPSANLNDNEGELLPLKS